MSKSKILAMDLSLNLPACAVLEYDSELRAIKIISVYHVDNKKRSSSYSTAQKLKDIQDMFNVIKLEHRDIKHFARERGFSRFVNTTQCLFKVAGVSDLAVLNLWGEKRVEDIPPTTVKRLLTGAGKAGKIEVETAVREYLSEEQRDFNFYSDDESDAVAVGISYLIKKGLLE